MAPVLRFNNLKLAASEQAPRICLAVLEVIGIAAYKNDSPFGVGRHLRDALSARLMVANERIHAVDAGLLHDRQGALSRWPARFAKPPRTRQAFLDELLEHGLLIASGVPGALRPQRRVRGRARSASTRC